MGFNLTITRGNDISSVRNPSLWVCEPSPSNNPIQKFSSYLLPLFSSRNNKIWSSRRNRWWYAWEECIDSAINSCNSFQGIRELINFIFGSFGYDYCNFESQVAVIIANTAENKANNLANALETVSAASSSVNGSFPDIPPPVPAAAANIVVSATDARNQQATEYLNLIVGRGLLTYPEGRISYTTGVVTPGSIQLDSHANMIVFGKYCFIISKYGK